LNDYDHERRRARTSRRWSHKFHSGTSSTVPAPPFSNARPTMSGPLAPPPLQQLRRSPLLMAVRSSQGRPEVIESGRPSTSHGVQPLRRQPAQLMPVTFVSGDPITVTNTESGGDDDDGRTEEDQDSKMGKA